MLEIRLLGVDFKAGINTATYEHFIDFAGQHGIEYVILDEGWYPLGDVLKVVPEIDMEALTAHAREKGVGLILWVVWKTFDDQLPQALDTFEKLVPGVTLHPHIPYPGRVFVSSAIRTPSRAQGRSRSKKRRPAIWIEARERPVGEG